MKEEEIKQALLNSIEEVFNAILGEATSNVVYSYLRKGFNLEVDMVLDESKKFADGLELLFGSGAKTILDSISKSLSSKLGIEYRSRLFEEQIEETKNLTMRKKRGV